MSTGPHNVIPLRPEHTEGPSEHCPACRAFDQRRYPTVRVEPKHPDWLSVGETVAAIIAVVVGGAVVVAALWVWL